MFKIKNVSVVNNWSDLLANVSAEMLHNENNIKIHVAGSDEILVIYYFESEYVVDVIETETYLNVNCVSVRNFNELLDEIEIAYGELLN